MAQLAEAIARHFLMPATSLKRRIIEIQGQNDHANVLVLQKSKNTIIMAKKSAHDQESHYWRHPYAESELFEPNL